MQGIDNNSDADRRPAGRQVWIRRRDQTTLFGVAVCLLCAMAGLWLYRGGHRGGLVVIDRAVPLRAEYVVDINHADWPELLQLPGLGETLARRIVSHRLEHGPYRRLDQLEDVNGIGRRTMERIRPYLLPIAEDSEFATIAEPEPAS